MNDLGTTVNTSIAVAQALTITVGDQSYVVEPADAPITIGRIFPAQILVPDSRISRKHLRLEVRGAQWVALDYSSNGVFLDRRSVPSVFVTDGLILHLGHPEGIAVRFAFAPPAPGAAASTVSLRMPTADDDGEDGWDDESGETTGANDYVDPGIARAGAAVAARRRELDIAQRALAKDKVMNAGSLIAFEKGRSWPRRSTLAKLEEVLGWQPGTISRLRWGQGSEPGSEERTVMLTNSAQTPFMAQALEIALDAIGNQVASLPVPSDAEFIKRVATVLAELRKLEQVAANAARSANGAADVVLILGAVRRQYRELMLRAARSPHATVGQQLFAARHDAELTAEEAANAAGVSVEAVSDVEADRPVGAEVTAAVHALLATLARR
jgi:transcriptional regulator with XRE-family HTH domain